MFIEWKNALERERLRVNLEKTKLMVSGSEEDEPIQIDRYLCVVCGKMWV